MNKSIGDVVGCLVCLAVFVFVFPWLLTFVGFN